MSFEEVAKLLIEAEALTVRLHLKRLVLHVRAHPLQNVVTRNRFGQRRYIDIYGDKKRVQRRIEQYGRLHIDALTSSARPPCRRW